MAQPRSERTHARTRPRTNWFIWTLIAVLLAAVLAGTIWVPIYNRTTPALGSFPFFYWYQLLWVPVVALVSWCAYALSRRAQRGTLPASGGPAPGGPAPGGPGGPAPGDRGPAPTAPATPLSAPPATDQALPRHARPGQPQAGTGPQAGPASGPPPLPKRKIPRRPEAN
jgi:Protein of unknown function (DUF3311)